MIVHLLFGHRLRSVGKLRDRLGDCFDVVGRKPGELGKLQPQQVRIAAGIRCGHTHARGIQLRFRELRLGIESRAETVAGDLLGALRRLLLLLHDLQARRVFVEFRVCQRRIEDHLRALVLRGFLRSAPLLPCRLQEVAAGKVDEILRRIQVDDRRRRAFDAEREAVRVSDARTERHLRQVLVAHLEVTGLGFLLVRIGDH